MAHNAQTFKATAAPTLVAAAADIYTNATDKPVVVRYVTEISSHISMTGTATVADAFVPANCVEVLNVDPGKSISALRGAAETDSVVWITEITQV